MSGGGGSSSDGGSARDAHMGTAGKTRDTESKSVSNGDNNREQRSVNQYSSKEGISVASRDPSAGDPDPEVDVPTSERKDTITSFTKNLQANVKANPLMATPGGIAYTAFQTGMANSMLGNITSRSGVGGETKGGEGEREFVRQVTPLAPYAIRGEIAPESQALNWYRNLGQNTQTAFNFSEGYATAKARQQGILGTPSPIRYHAVNESPFFNWLKDNSLNKGIL